MAAPPECLSARRDTPGAEAQNLIGRTSRIRYTAGKRGRSWFGLIHRAAAMLKYFEPFGRPYDSDKVVTIPVRDAKPRKLGFALYRAAGSGIGCRAAVAQRAAVSNRSASELP